MKTFFRLLMLGVVVGGWVLSAACLHVVRVPGNWPVIGDRPWLGKAVFVTKDRMGFRETYVDARTWTAEEAAKHPAVVQRLLQTGKEGALAHVGDRAQLSEAVQKAQDAQPAATGVPVAHTPS